MFEGVGGPLFLGSCVWVFEINCLCFSFLVFGGMLESLSNPTAIFHQISSRISPRSFVMSEFEVVPTSKGGELMLYGGYSWTKKNSRKDGVSVWRCTCRSSANCAAILWTTQTGGVWECVKTTGHTHDSGPCSIIRIRTDGMLRGSPGTPSETVHHVIAEAVGNTPLCDHVVLDERKLRRTVCAARKKAQNANNEDEGNYTSLETLLFPERMLQNRGESVLLFDTGSGSDRILAFGVMRHVRLMERSDIVLGDGTFQVAPQLWKQQYTLHVNVQGFCFLVVYFLLPGKSKPLYQKLLRIIQDRF